MHAGWCKARLAQQPHAASTASTQLHAPENSHVEDRGIHAFAYHACFQYTYGATAKSEGEDPGGLSTYPEMLASPKGGTALISRVGPWAVAKAHTASRVAMVSEMYVMVADAHADVVCAGTRRERVCDLCSTSDHHHPKFGVLPCTTPPTTTTQEVAPDKRIEPYPRHRAAAMSALPARGTALTWQTRASSSKTTHTPWDSSKTK